MYIFLPTAIDFDTTHSNAHATSHRETSYKKFKLPRVTQSFIFLRIFNFIDRYVLYAMNSKTTLKREKDRDAVDRWMDFFEIRQ